MNERPLHSGRWVTYDPPDRRREHFTPADTDGTLDWDKAVRLGWRPAWAIRSRRGAGRAFAAMISDWLKRRRD